MRGCDGGGGVRRRTREGEKASAVRSNPPSPSPSLTLSTPSTHAKAVPPLLHPPSLLCMHTHSDPIHQRQRTHHSAVRLDPRVTASTSTGNEHAPSLVLLLFQLVTAAEEGGGLCV